MNIKCQYKVISNFKKKCLIITAEPLHRHAKSVTKSRVNVKALPACTFMFVNAIIERLASPLIRLKDVLEPSTFQINK